MKKAYSLLELQAALFLGLVTAAMSAKALWFEHERRIRMEDMAVIRMELRALDAATQWALAGANQIEPVKGQLEFQCFDTHWSLNEKGLLRDKSPALHLRSTIHLDQLKLDKNVLSFRTTLTYRTGEAVVSLRYLLNDGLVVTP